MITYTANITTFPDGRTCLDIRSNVPPNHTDGEHSLGQIVCKHLDAAAKEAAQFMATCGTVNCVTGSTEVVDKVLDGLMNKPAQPTTPTIIDPSLN